MGLQLIRTSDQSFTLYNPELDETYHSVHGAIDESKHVYIEAGLAEVAREKDQINIFEFGFGTGLNALLSWIFAENHGKRIAYDTVEKFPVEASVYTQLNYGELLGNKEKLEALHQAPWNEFHVFSAQFCFCKYELDILDFSFASDYYDLVFYDAFGPSKQSEAWQPLLLEKIHAALKAGGVMVTYCSQGQFRRNLKGLEFEVQRLPGPKGKREMIRATKH